jgi:hypothetical protein
MLVVGDLMSKSWNPNLILLVALPVVLPTAVLLASLGLHLGSVSGLLDRIDVTQSGSELYARLFLTGLLSMLYAPLVLLKRGRQFLRRDRRALIIAALFAAGAIFALADVFHPIRAEGNVIRYWTSGVLALAGGIALFHAARSGFAWVDRLVGGGFGLVLLAAAADEVFQLHERAGNLTGQMGSTGSGIDPQDLVTLGIALAGAGMVVVLIIAPRVLPQARAMMINPRYRQVSAFFALAALSFLIAMLLDTFDGVLEAGVAQLRHALLLGGATTDIPIWIGENHATQSANALEELLEYFAAISFLMMIGTLFRVRRLGCDDREDG